MVNFNDIYIGQYCNKCNESINHLIDFNNFIEQKIICPNCGHINFTDPGDWDDEVTILPDDTE